jgi:tRNA modification GTPase
MADTIAAIATAPGVGGIGVLRISGPQAIAIGCALSGRRHLIPRQAHFARLCDEAGAPLDEGLVLAFPGPHSFTGEDVVEVHGHGGPVVLQSLLGAVLRAGARQAGPGEFSQRAFLNDRMDLIQAEAIADLIHARSEAAHRAALRSLAGGFSKAIHHLEQQLTELRVWVEASLDFPDEDLDLLADPQVLRRLGALEDGLATVLRQSQSGQVLTEGVRAVLLGEPNVGKSSLMNRLTDNETSIVTDVPGTTRDIVKEQVLIDGIPLLLLDTAGLREQADQVETEGIRRAQAAAAAADLLLYVSDARDETAAGLDRGALETRLGFSLPPAVCHIRNKSDLLPAPPPGLAEQVPLATVWVSAKSGDGLDALRGAVKAALGLQMENSTFSARARHLVLLKAAQHALREARTLLESFPSADLVADQLKIAHDAFSEMTGQVTPDDLLGKIFSTFCIGK